MNGRHDNYAFTQERPRTRRPTPTEPTPAPACATMTASVCGARRSPRSAFSSAPTSCSRPATRPAPASRASCGTRAGSTSCRDRYWELFDVPAQIEEAEARYAELTPGRNGEPLWQSDLYSVPKASSRTANKQPLPTDEELLVLFSA